MKLCGACGNKVKRLTCSLCLLVKMYPGTTHTQHNMLWSIPGSVTRALKEPLVLFKCPTRCLLATQWKSSASGELSRAAPRTGMFHCHCSSSFQKTSFSSEWHGWLPSTNQSSFVIPLPPRSQDSPVAQETLPIVSLTKAAEAFFSPLSLPPGRWSPPPRAVTSPNPALSSLLLYCSGDAPLVAMEQSSEM